MKNIVHGESHTEVESGIITVKWGKLQRGQISRISVKIQWTFLILSFLFKHKHHYLCFF